MSTTEAEYVALGQGVKAALFTGAVLCFICPALSRSCVRIFEDDQGAIALVVLLGKSTLTCGSISSKKYFVRRRLK